MSLEDAIKSTAVAEEEAVLDISEDAELDSEEELVENEVGNEEEALDEEVVAEAKVEEDEDEDKKDEEKVEESAPVVPKTKAGVINAALEMFKKAKKEDAQKLYAKLTKVEESEDDGTVDKAVDTVAKDKKAPKAKLEAADYSEDLDILVAEEATLSDGFRVKAGAIFEAAYASKVGAEIDRLEGEYAQNLEEEVADIQSSLVEKVDSYLNYVVENWMKENEVAVETGLRSEIAEDFMSALQVVFKEHYIEVPEGKVDLVDELSSQVAELEESLNKTTEENIRLYESTQSLERAEIVRRHSSGLAETEAEKLSSLVEDIEFDNAESFEMKVSVVKESYFKQDVTESVDEVNAAIGNQEADEVQSISNSMAAYTQAITKSIK